MTHSIVSDLQAKLDEYQISIDRDNVELLGRYAEALWDWNTKLNLTRHTDIEKFVARDLVDSMKLAELIGPDEEVIDLGTGGGVPGIPLSILRPDLTISVCESVGKKAKAVNEMIAALDLNIAVFNARLEHLLDDFRFDAVVARAVGPLWKICFWLQDHWLDAGRVLAVKGPNWIEERKEAKARGLLQQVELRCASNYITPGTEIENFILKLWPKGQDER